MKYERTTHLARDYKKLPDDHQKQFRDAARDFHDAAVEATAGKSSRWPSSLRVKTVQGADGIWEMTWSKDHPDGRATWEWVDIDGEAGVRWRRVGDHGVLDDP